VTDQLPGQTALAFNDTPAEKFEAFHAANPKVYAILLRLAREWVATFGQTKLGIATIYEAARWQISLATNDPKYKLNNNFRAYYARLLMTENGDLDGLFDVRDSAADMWIAGRTA
jgi:hypothetical protein